MLVIAETARHDRERGGGVYRICARDDLVRQLCLEERHDLFVELAMKGGPIEPPRIAAGCARKYPHHQWAWRQEYEMAGLGYDVILRLHRQLVINMLGMKRLGHDLVALGAPQLDRRGDAGQSVMREHDAKRRGDHGRRNARVVREG